MKTQFTTEAKILIKYFEQELRIRNLIYVSVAPKLDARSIASSGVVIS